MAGRRNLLPRKSSPAGISIRLAGRVKHYTPDIPKGAHGTTRGHKPGSRNPRKAGRLWE